MPIQRPFSLVLRQLREVSKLTQEELAHEAGLDRTYIGLLERGKRVPSITVVFAIADALKIKASRIMSLMERH